MVAKNADDFAPLALLARKLRGQTQAAFAAAIGINTTTQARRELGYRDTGSLAEQLYRLIAIAQAAGLGELLDGALDYEPRSEAHSLLRIIKALMAESPESLGSWIELEAIPPDQPPATEERRITDALLGWCRGAAIEVSIDHLDGLVELVKTLSRR